MSEYWQNVANGSAFVGFMLGGVGVVFAVMLAWSGVEETRRSWTVVGVLGALVGLALAVLCGAYLAVQS